MENSDPLPNSSENRHFTKTIERTSLIKVWISKANMERILQVGHRMWQKSCRRACQMFCCPLDLQLCERAICYREAETHQPADLKTTEASLMSSASTILIVNISNSTLIDCAIGNDACPSTVEENQLLMEDYELQMKEQMRCSCRRGHQRAAQSPRPPVPPPPLCPPLPSTEPQSITIHSSHLSYTIIGNNNYMQVEQLETGELEE